MKFDLMAGDTLLDMMDRKQAVIDVVTTPFPAWNEICGEEGGMEGLARRWLVIVGGVTGTGKSYFASNVCAHAVREGHLVGMVNFEMSQMAVGTRYLAALAGAPQWRMDMGKYFSPEIWLKAKAEADRIYEETGGGLLANDSAVFSLSDIERSYEVLTRRGVRLIVIDYAQLVQADGADGIAQRSEKVATRLRELTHEYRVSTIAISQFNREEAKKAGPPTMHGLMGGGIWEHAANQIVLLDHTIMQEYGTNAIGGPQGQYTQALFEKNRHGRANLALPLRRDYDTQRFEEYEPGTDPGDPFMSPEDVEVGGDPHWSDHDDNDSPF